MTREEKKQQYDRGYKAGQRSDNIYYRGYKTGVANTKSDVRGWLTGIRSCVWLPNLLREYGFKVMED